MVAWNVFLNGGLIDVVFYRSDCDINDVIAGLIEHDGLPLGIEVYRT